MSDEEALAPRSGESLRQWEMEGETTLLIPGPLDPGTRWIDIVVGSVAIGGLVTSTVPMVLSPLGIHLSTDLEIKVYGPLLLLAIGVTFVALDHNRRAPFHKHPLRLSREGERIHFSRFHLNWVFDGKGEYRRDFTEEASFDLIHVALHQVDSAATGRSRVELLVEQGRARWLVDDWPTEEATALVEALHTQLGIPISPPGDCFPPGGWRFGRSGLTRFADHDDDRLEKVSGPRRDREWLIVNSGDEEFDAAGERKGLASFELSMHPTKGLEIERHRGKGTLGIVDIAPGHGVVVVQQDGELFRVSVNELHLVRRPDATGTLLTTPDQAEAEAFAATLAENTGLSRGVLQRGDTEPI